MVQQYALCGMSLFETLLARNGSFWCLPYHWQRLVRSALTLGFKAPAWEEFRAAVLQAHDARQCQVLRFTLFQTGGRWSEQPAGQTWQVLQKPFKPAPISAPISLGFGMFRVAQKDPLRRHKTGSRLVYETIAAQAHAAGYDDGVLQDRGGFLLEATVSNLLFFHRGRWQTPPLSMGVLPGIARRWLLEREVVAVSPLHQRQLPQIKAMAVVNAVRGIVPVARLQGWHFETSPVRQLVKRVGPRRFQAP